MPIINLKNINENNLDNNEYIIDKNQENNNHIDNNHNQNLIFTRWLINETLNDKNPLTASLDIYLILLSQNIIYL